MHGGIDSDIVGELARNGGGETFGEIGNVEDAGSIVHATSEKTSERQDAGMRRAESAPLVFLATGAFASEEIRPSAFNAGALDGFVDIEHDLIPCGKLNGFLVMKHAKLRMVEFALAIYQHLGSRITRFYIMDMMIFHKLIRRFELAFIIIDETNRLMMTNELNALTVGVIGNATGIKAGGWHHKFIIFAVLEPIAFPAVIPTLDQ